MSEKKIKILYVNDQPPLFKALQPRIYNLLSSNKEIETIFHKMPSNTFSVWPPANQQDRWWYIADAEIRVSPNIGCDRISLKEPKLLYAQFCLFFEHTTFISNVEINYHFDTDTLVVRNFHEIEIRIRAMICSDCLRLISKCPHSTDKEWDRYLTSQNILYVDEIEPPPAQINLSKFSALLAGMAKTLRLKATHKLNALAEEIMTKNPEITEEQLASELFKRSNELSK
jgi:hypothetical protein